MDILNFTNKKIILRTDFNVPIKDNKILSYSRIDQSMKTINKILNSNPKQLVIISHLDRPIEEDIKNNKFSLLPIKIYLENILNQSIFLSKSLDIPNNKIILIENIRYFKEETHNIPSTLEFRNKLSSLGDIYINDAFACCHRSHSSIIGINTKEKCFGYLVEKEVKYLQNIFSQKKDSTLILGGSKINDKIKLIKNLIPQVDKIFIGGGMVFTFMKYFGYSIGTSLFDSEGYKLVPEILNFAKIHNTEFIFPLLEFLLEILIYGYKYIFNIYIFPIDFICNNNFANNGNIIITDKNIPNNYMGLDIGPKTIQLFKNKLEKI